MKYVVAILALVVVLLLLDRRRPPAPTALPTTAAVLDSVRRDSIRVDTVVRMQVRWLRQAPVDTLALILRDRARRPVVLAGDTLVQGYGIADTISSAEGVDSTHALVSRDVLVSTTARQLVDSGQHVLDQGRIRVQSAVIDSLDQHLDQCQEALEGRNGWTAYGRGYMAGAASGAAVGLGVCVLLK